MDTRNNNVDDTTKNTNSTLHNNTVADNRDGTNQSHEPLVINSPSSSNTIDVNSNTSQRKKFNFQGVPSHLST